MFTVAKHGSTITHEVLGQFDAARVMLRPASDGTGVIAGGGVRAVLELGGVRNVLAKSLGTTNPINMAKATVVALQSLRRPEDVARIRGKQISEVLPLPRIKPDVAGAGTPVTGDAHQETTPGADASGVAPATGDVHEETALASDVSAQNTEPAGEPDPTASESPVAKPEASGQPAAPDETKPKRSIRKKKKDDS